MQRSIHLIVLMALGVGLPWVARAAEPPAATTEPAGEALYRSALAAQTGKGAALDLERGKVLLLQAAEAGNAHAMSRLGDMYQIPDGGVQINVNVARKWYDKAADAGDPYGCLWAANLQDKKVTPEVDQARFARALRTARAAQKTDVSANFVMAVFYSTGNGNVTTNPVVALSYLQTGAKAGDVNAMRELASSYAHGDGTPKDLDQAFKWYSKAAESGMSVHLMDLGICYDAGHGVAKDPAKALQLYLDAADRGSPRCMTNAAQMLAAGEGAAADLPRAAGLFQKAADLGWPPAIYYLGICYSSGKGVSEDQNAALKWMRMAAEGNNPRAKKYLADHNLPITP